MITPFNDDFKNPANVEWFKSVMKEKFPDKPIVFLPCASAGKTRVKFGKKQISQSTSHQYMSKITRNPTIEKIIISEPLTVIPYSMEKLMPDYEYPPKLLHARPEQLKIFVMRLRKFLQKLKQEGHRNVFFLGGKHHRRILQTANRTVKLPIYYERLKGGSVDYKSASVRLLKMIKK